MSDPLASVRATFEALGGLSIPAVHIAGSKGKGTTAHLLAEIARMNKNTVGLFTSPFVVHETEMVAVDGVTICPDHYAEFQDRVRDLGPELSEFEVQTLAAFEYFKERACDLIVVECGRGGRTDASNVLTDKALTILTHIELEHQEFLGNTLTEITREKLGICMPGVPLLSSPNQAPEVLEEIRLSGHDVQFASSFELGFFHPDSVGLAIAGAEFLGFSFDSVIEEALLNEHLPGRFELLHYGPHILLLDGAHTYDSVQYVLSRLPELVQKNCLPEPQFAIHFLKDKRSDLWTLFPRNRTVWVPLNDERAGTKPELLDALELHEIFDRLQTQKEPQLWVLMGSFRLVNRVHKLLGM